MKEKEMGATLRELRERAGLTIKDVICELNKREISISDKALYSYESGKRAASADMFLALCEIYKCNNILEVFSNIEVDYSVPDDTEWAIIEKYRDLDDHGRESVNIMLERETLRVQAINNIRKQLDTLTNKKTYSGPTYYISYYQRLASAGNGEYLFDDIPTETIEVPANDLSERADFVIGVNGDSMEPLYYDGDKVYVQKKDEIGIGEIGIFTRGPECFIKELGSDCLISRNKKYADIPASNDIKCVGLVLGKVEE